MLLSKVPMKSIKNNLNKKMSKKIVTKNKFSRIEARLLNRIGHCLQIAITSREAT